MGCQLLEVAVDTIGDIGPRDTVGFAGTARRATQCAVARLAGLKITELVPKDLGQSVMVLGLIACCVAAE